MIINSAIFFMQRMELRMEVCHRNTQLEYKIVDSLEPLVFLVENIQGGAEATEKHFPQLVCRKK